MSLSLPSAKTPAADQADSDRARRDFQDARGREAARRDEQSSRWDAADARDHRTERKLQGKLKREFAAIVLLAALGVLAVWFFEPSHARRPRGETAAADTPRQPSRTAPTR